MYTLAVFVVSSKYFCLSLVLKYLSILKIRHLWKQCYSYTNIFFWCDSILKIYIRILVNSSRLCFKISLFFK